MKVIIILVLFCLLGFVCGRVAKKISNEINNPIECEGICPIPEEYR